uniref:Evasin P1134 n=1 Tax=Ixodes ricinus TaxID=34613 RepID=E1134_IXORI|nr:RecName: Full=Evasin P1134; Flags: Precursor [Ixodes ricinus]
MEVKTFAFLQIAVFIALGIQIFAAVTAAADANEEVFTVEYCGMNCTQKSDGTWTECSGKNKDCRCYHESDAREGLCLSTEYTDFSQFETPSNSDLEAATPRPRKTLYPVRNPHGPKTRGLGYDKRILRDRVKFLI